MPAEETVQAPNAVGEDIAVPTVALDKTELYRTPLPRRFRRAGVRRTQKWNMPRSFAGYTAADYTLSVRGAAPKCIVKNDADPNDWYMAKGTEMWGAIETFTEFLLNQLGEKLEFPMAHSGLVLVDGELRFASRNFLQPGETLTHGSLLLESAFDCDLDGVGKNPWDEQRTYDIDLIGSLLQRVCGTDNEAVQCDLVQLLVFDALIGCMDRHMQNWGVISTATAPRHYRLAPIFDTARALLWDYDEVKLERLGRNQHALEGYANRARPKIGCAKFGRAVNHFSLVEYLTEQYPAAAQRALTKVTPEKVRAAAEIMREYPIKRSFSPLRRDTVTRILLIRAERLSTIAAGKGEGHV